jgi:hypothetical protein
MMYKSPPRTNRFPGILGGIAAMMAIAAFFCDSHELLCVAIFLLGIAMWGIGFGKIDEYKILKGFQGPKSGDKNGNRK